jgi:hypothetical protein
MEGGGNNIYSVSERINDYREKQICHLNSLENNRLPKFDFITNPMDMEIQDHSKRWF